MSEKTQRKQTSPQVKKISTIEDEINTDESDVESYNEINSPVNPSNRVDINDSSLAAETPSESSIIVPGVFEGSNSKENILFSDSINGTAKYEEDLTHPQKDSTLAFSISETSKVELENQLLGSDSSELSDMLGGHNPSLSKPVLPIKPGTVLSLFEYPSTLASENENPITAFPSKRIDSNPESENESEDDVAVLKPKKRDHMSDMASDEENLASEPGLKRLVKKSEYVQMDSPDSDASVVSLSQFKNFVADQADEEDEHGELIAYSGSDEDLEEDEYDFDDLEVDFDGPVNQDAMRDLHNKMMRDAENKGYKLLTRKDQTANRILGDDDGHQLARRQRNRNTFLDPEQEYRKKAGSEKIEECLIANFKSSAVNNVNEFRSRISRNKSKRSRSLQVNFTDEQIQRALSDPNPRMALFRASLPSSSDPIVSNNNTSSLKHVLSRSSTIHSVPKRFKPLSKSNSDTIPTSGNLAQAPFKSFLSGRSVSKLSNSDPTVRAEHIDQLKRQFDTKAPENQITKLSMTNARRFGYSSFKIYGKRSALSDPKNQTK